MSNTCTDCKFYEKGDDKGRHTFDCTFHKESYLWITPCSRFKQKGTKMKEEYNLTLSELMEKLKPDDEQLAEVESISDPLYMDYDGKLCWFSTGCNVLIDRDMFKLKYKILPEKEEPEPEQEEPISREFNCPHCDKEIAVLRKEEVDK